VNFRILAIPKLIIEELCQLRVYPENDNDIDFDSMFLMSKLNIETQCNVNTTENFHIEIDSILSMLISMLK